MQYLIPIYLLVGGVVSVCLDLSGILQSCCEQKKKDSQPSAFTSFCNFSESIIGVFMLAWFICGELCRDDMRVVVLYQQLEDLNIRSQLVKERSRVDPDFWERSLTKRFVHARALSVFGIIKNFDHSNCSHVTRVLACKQIVVSFGVLFVLKCSLFLSFILICCSHLFADSRLT